MREKEGFKKQGLVRFLKNCKKRMRKKMLLIWDNAPSHKSKEIKAYLSQQDKNNPPIWLENIPPYSPELNPIEQLWSCLKKRMTNKFMKTTKELKEEVVKELEEISRDKKLIISFFKNKELDCYQFFD